MGQPVSFGDNTGKHSDVGDQKKLRKGQVCLCSSFFACLLPMLGISIYEVSHTPIPKEETCVYPHYDLDHNPPEENECIIYTRCEFEKNETNLDRDSAGHYELVSDSIMILSPDYRVKGQTGKCPLHWELPGYHVRPDGSCVNEGFGCCEIPLDILCDQIMHFNEDNINYAGWLYDQMNRDDNHHIYMNIPKKDIEGSNCPTPTELLCETYHSDIYYSLPHLSLALVMCGLFLCLTNIRSNRSCDIYEEPSYTGVSEFASV